LPISERRIGNFSEVRFVNPKTMLLLPARKLVHRVPRPMRVFKIQIPISPFRHCEYPRHRMTAVFPRRRHGKPGSIDNLLPTVEGSTSPFFTALCEGGLVEVWKRYAPEFTPDAGGHIGKCHFCLELRKHLFEQGTFTELRPAEMYRS
jgi:hypothetical protein